METPKEIYLLNLPPSDGLIASKYQILEDDIKYIRADIAKLTWEDIDKIMHIIDYLKYHTDIPLEGRITFCEEVLHKFNEQKDNGQKRRNKDI
jgi:hypothetical protein